jgi:hypothetical protein
VRRTRASSSPPSSHRRSLASLQALSSNLGGSIETCGFVGNTASVYGGAVHMDRVTQTSVVSTNFTRNVASRSGGALSLLDCNCTFTARCRCGRHCATAPLRRTTEDRAPRTSHLVLEEEEAAPKRRAAPASVPAPKRRR